MKRNRINIRVSDQLWERLTMAAAAHNSTMTAIIETAIEQYFDPDQVQNRDAQLLSRIDQFDTRQDRIETDLRLCTETLAQYVLYWLTRMDPLPEAEREAAYALGKRRYDHFVQQVATRMAKPEGR
ncbi:MAG: ribbon-helix-helix protein, CopG family [Pseudomonadota bacterium]